MEGGGEGGEGGRGADREGDLCALGAAEGAARSRAAEGRAARARARHTPAPNKRLRTRRCSCAVVVDLRGGRKEWEVGARRGGDSQTCGQGAGAQSFCTLSTSTTPTATTPGACRCPPARHPSGWLLVDYNMPGWGEGSQPQVEVDDPLGRRAQGSNPFVSNNAEIGNNSPARLTFSRPYFPF